MQLFISHSSKNDATRAVRDQIADVLRDAEILDRAFDVYLDTSLKPGDRWRAELDTWLAKCHGGVILFSQDAVESGWVLKEAQILTWRRAVDHRFVLIPILFEPLNPDATRMGDYLPIKLAEIQFIQPGLTPEQLCDDAAVFEQLAKNVKQAVIDHAPPKVTEDGPMSKWIRAISIGLQNPAVPPSAFPEFGAALGIPRDDFPSQRNQPPTEEERLEWADMLARRLVLLVPSDSIAGHREVDRVTFSTVVDQLEILFGLTDSGLKRGFAERYFPVWVNPEAARDIVPVASGDPPRVVCIENASFAELGRHYVDRAEFIAATLQGRVISAPDLQPGLDQAVIEEYERAINRPLAILGERATWADKVADAVENLGPYYVILHGQAAKPSVVNSLVKTYKHPTFVLLPDTDVPTAQDLHLEELPIVRPPITSDRGRRIVIQYRRLTG